MLSFILLVINHNDIMNYFLSAKKKYLDKDKEEYLILDIIKIVNFIWRNINNIGSKNYNINNEYYSD